MKAKLFICDSDENYKTVHKIYTNKSYADHITCNAIIDVVEVDCSSTNFNDLALKYYEIGGTSQKICALCGWQNFLLKFENDEVAELHRTRNALYRHDPCAANWEAIRRFKEDVATAIAGKSELILSDEEDFIV